MKLWNCQIIYTINYMYIYHFVADLWRYVRRVFICPIIKNHSPMRCFSRDNFIFQRFYIPKIHWNDRIEDCWVLYFMQDFYYFLQTTFRSIWKKINVPVAPAWFVIFITTIFNHGAISETDKDTPKMNNRHMCEFRPKISADFVRAIKSFILYVKQFD